MQNYDKVERKWKDDANQRKNKNTEIILNYESLKSDETWKFFWIQEVLMWNVHSRPTDEDQEEKLEFKAKVWILDFRRKTARTNCDN